MADMLSQEEIDALLNGGGSSDEEESEVTLELLTAEEKDALGEIGNISMGTAATTLFTLLGQKVTITTPRVSETTMKALIGDFEDPFVTINIQYKIGIEGLNLLIINEKDVKIITDLMMGGDGTNIADELTDLHLSAIGEAMNQMIGSSSTSLSEMLGQKIDISPPEAISENLENLTEDELGVSFDENVVKIAFRMTVGDLIDSEIMQVMPIEVAKQLVNNVMNAGKTDEPEPQPEPQPAPQAAPQQQPQPQVQEQQIPQQPVYEQPIQQPVYQQPQQMPQQPMQQQPAAGYYQVPPTAQRQAVNAQPVQFQNFGAINGEYGVQSDISLIKDVPLEITVELGRTFKKISEILDFTPGTVVELDRLVGESLDILANGKRIAKGEVVVVDENYGIRITEIIVPEKRLSNL